jgi:ABC-type cobalamin/Fe3+-siderophores transport system ATPase subunit
MFHVKHSAIDLRTENLRVRSALRELTLSFLPGELTGVIGPNGAGKTTLLRCLSGDCLPDAGAVYLEGRPLSHWSAQERSQHLAFLPQNPPFSFPFTVRELIGLGSASAEMQKEAIAVLDLSELMDRPLTTLSGGEQRRAAIARALAQGAPCLLLDEPLSQLDPRFQLALLKHLRECSGRGMTVVLVLHDLRLAGSWCSQLVLLDQGQRRAQGTPSQVLSAEMLEDTFQVPRSFIG